MYVNGDTNGNLILEAMIDYDKGEIPNNESDEDKLRRLKNRYDEKTLKERQFKQKSSGEQIDQLSSHIAAIDRRINSNKGNEVRRHEVVMQRMDRMESMMRQILQRPYRLLGPRSNNCNNNNSNRNNQPKHDNRTLQLLAANSAAEVAAEQQRAQSSLTNNLRSLHTLWFEYEMGIGGKKPAKLFTAAERGKDRFRYSQRKVFWIKVAEMVRAGWQSTEAINKIINHYGSNLSVTATLIKMRKDQKNNSYPTIFDLPSA